MVQIPRGRELRTIRFNFIAVLTPKTLWLLAQREPKRCVEPGSDGGARGANRLGVRGQVHYPYHDTVLWVGSPANRKQSY